MLSVTKVGLLPRTSFEILVEKESQRSIILGKVKKKLTNTIIIVLYMMCAVFPGYLKYMRQEVKTFLKSKIQSIIKKGIRP